VTGDRDRIVFVVADPDDQIAEVVEDDNLTFRPLEVLSLPDLAVSEASISLTPAFPRPGEPVTATVAVSNLGEQPAAGVEVRIYDADPLAGGVLLAAGQLLSLPPLATAAAELPFTASSGGQLTVHAVVDPEGAVEESSTANNAASRQFGVQDGDFALSSRYFSPNGDGVLDVVRFYFRLPEPATVDIRAVDRRGRVTRTFDSFPGVTEGEIEWDGRDERGRLARDGDYTLQVVAEDSVAGEAAVVLDNDKSGLLRAAGTPYESTPNLSCLLPEISNTRLTGDEHWIYFSTATDAGAYPAGIHRISTSTFGVQQVYASDDARVLFLAVADDTSGVAWSERRTSPTEHRLLVARGDGTDPVEIGAATVLNQRAPAFFDPGALDLYYLDGGQLFRAPLDAPESRQPAFAGTIRAPGDLLPSPDGTTVLIRAEAGGIVASLWLLDLESGASVALLDPAEYSEPLAFGVFYENPSFDWSEYFAWSADSSHLAVANGTELLVFDRDGDLDATIEVPGLEPPDSAGPVPEGEWTYFLERPRWSSLGSELAGVISHQRFNDALIWSASQLVVLDTDAGEAESIAWSEPSVSCNCPPVQVPEATKQRTEHGAGESDKEATGLTVAFEELFWPPGDDALLLADDAQTTWAIFLGEPGDGEGCEPSSPSCPGEVIADPDNRWQLALPGFAGASVDFSRSAVAPSGRFLTFASARDDADPQSLCFETGGDTFLLRSLQNLTADLRIRRSVDPTNVLLEGTAADLHFKRYSLEYTRIEEPDAWKPVAPPRGTPVLDGLFQTWVPPAPGTWLVRLTVEDLAGNVRRAVRQVSAAAFPEIADVYVVSDLFSPNSDGALDRTFVHYEALGPVVVEVRIFDEGGRLVAILVDEAPAAGERLVPWDGRGFGGAVVADGTYSLRVQGSYELETRIDTTPIEVSLELLDPYRFDETSQGSVARLSPALRYGIAAASLGELAEETVERGEGTLPGLWQGFPRFGAHRRSGDLSLAEFTGGNFRVRVADFAGNRTVVSTGLGSEKLMLAAFGDHEIAGDGSVFEPIAEEAGLGGLIQADLDGAVYDGFETSTGTVRMRLAETLRAAVQRVWIEHRGRGSQLPWTETEVDVFYRPGSSMPLGSPPSKLFEVVWSLPGGSAEEVRIAAEDFLGQILRTASFVVTPADDDDCIDLLRFQGRLRLDDGVFANDGCVDGAELLAEVEALLTAGGLDVERQEVLWGYTTVEGLTEVRLLLQSGEDPAYAFWSAVPSAGEGGGAFLFVPDPELLPCVGYSARLSGQTPPLVDPQTGILGSRTLSAEGGFGSRCLSLTASAVAALAESCGEPSPQQVTVTVTAGDEGSGIALRNLSLRRTSPGGEQTLLSVSAPLPGFGYDVDLDLAAEDEGVVTLVARVENVAGHVVARELGVGVDRTPPEIAVTFPEPGEVVCGFRNRLSVEGTLSDVRPSRTAGPFRGRLGSSGPEVALPFWEITGVSCDDCGEQVTTDAAELWQVSGGLAEVHDVEGPLEHQLRVWDRGGNLACLDHSYLVDAFVPPLTFGFDQRDVSPNGDGIQDQLRLSWQTDEPMSVDVEVWDGILDPNLGCTVDGPVVRTLADDLPIAADGQLFWDGRDGSGAVVADGAYVFVVRNRDACGNDRSQSVCVFVDTVPPYFEILRPSLADRSLPVEVEIEYVAEALHTLSFGETHDPVSWQPLPTGNPSFDVPTGAWNPGISRWNTFGLEGDWTIRLEGRDLAGNRAEVRQPVTLPVREDLITYLEPQPSLFSPNGDGRRESVALRFGVLRQADVELRVERLDGSPLEVLADERVDAGGSVFSWNGRLGPGQPVADGRYRAVLTATLASDPNLVQEAAVTFEVDATAPVVEVVSPAAGFSAGGVVRGTVSDLHFDRYTVSLAADGGGAPAWSEIGSGSESVLGGFLADLGELEEADYLLRVTAEDEAESRTEVVVPFTVDLTAPEAEILAPAANAILGAGRGAAEVAGSAADAHLASWLLEAGAGDSPGTWTVLASATGEASPATVATLWDPAPLADGIHTLRLTATDFAGNSTAATRAVTVDNTPPAAVLTAPADGGFVTGPVTVAGTADDLHLVDYRLEIAAAGGPAQWIEIRHATEAVVAGVLHDWRALPPDGDWLLRLTATDAADNFRQVQIAVTVDTVPPAAPTLSAAAENGTDARLTWTAVEAADLAGYRVLRGGQEIATVAADVTTYLDPSLAEGTWVYRVTAFDEAGNQGQPSNQAEVEIDVTPPVARIFAPADGARVSGLVDVEGSASSDDFREYRLYAEPVAGGAVQLLRRSPVAVQAALLGQWSSFGAAEEARFRLRLEAEDLAGNVALDEVEVVVDNQAPAAPAELTATLSGVRDADLEWTAVDDPHLRGYLLFRDGRVANAGGPVVGDLTPFVLTSTSYLDAALADGTYSWIVHAVDEAGNLGAPSDSASLTVETRAPRAVVVSPAQGEVFEAEIAVSAETEDADVVRVQFQWRAGGGPWTDFGAADTSAPWSAVLDPLAAGLDYGDVELRAVATDAGERTDAAPAAITAVYADLTPPQAVASVTTLTDGGEVTVNWTAVDDADLAGYHVYRRQGSVTAKVRLTGSPQAATSLLDSGLDDGRWSYSVTAVDQQGNESEPSAEAAARVFAPLLEQPYTPTPFATATLAGFGPAGYAALVESSGAGGTTTLPPLPLAPAAAGLPLFDAAFTAELTLSTGLTTVTVGMEDAAGNRSKPAQVRIVAGDVPQPPQGLTATVAGLDVDLAWDADPEPDLLGYRLFRDGAPVAAAEIGDFDELLASTELSPFHGAEAAVDGDPETFWWPAAASDQWIELGWPGLRVITGVEIDWLLLDDGFAYPGKDFRVEGWFDGVWVPLARIDDNAAAANFIDLALPYRTDRLRLFVETALRSGSVPLRLAEVRLHQAPLLPPTPTAAGDAPGDGFHVYQLTAFSELGFESVPSDPTAEVAVGDVIPPSAPELVARVVDGWDVELTFDAVADAVRYDLYRDGAKFAEHTDLGSLLAVDPRRPTGTYRYTARAVDAAGNASPPSNEAQVTVAVAPPSPPLLLSVTSPPEGGALDLTWQPGNGETPFAYAVFRSTVAGAAGEPVATTVAAGLRDQPLVDGTRYYFTVAAYDEALNLGSRSNELSGVPENTLPQLAPALHFPTIPGRVLMTATPQVTIAGRAAPGVDVTLRRGGQDLATTPSTAAVEVEPSGFTGVFAPPIPSSDGRYVLVDDFGVSYLVDFEDGDVTTYPGFGRWLDDGRLLLTDPFAASGQSEIRRVSPEDGGSELVTAVEYAYLAVPSPTADLYAVIGEIFDGSAGFDTGIFLYDPAAETWTLVVAAEVFAIELSSLKWSPDGSRFAWVDYASDASLASFHLESGSRQVIDLALDEPGFDWSPDGSALTFRSRRDGGAKIWIYDFEDDHASVAVDDPDATWPRFSPDGRALAFLGPDLRVRDLATGLDEVVYATDFLGPFEWTASGHLAVTEDSHLLRLTPPGRFELSGVALAAGDNVFTAASGGVESEPIVISTTGGGLPDVAVELTVIPSLTYPGGEIRATVTVRSQGTAEAPPVPLSTAVVGPGGFFLELMDGELVGPLPPGQSHTVARQVVLDAAPGAYTVVAAVDPAGDLAEVSERNNLATAAVTVVAEGSGPLLEVTTDQPLYLRDEELVATVEVLATGVELDGALEIAVEDDEGFLVRSLGSHPVVGLGFGQVHVQTASWDVGSTFAGTYRVRARFVDSGGALAAEAFAAFTIYGEAEVDAAAATDAAVYTLGAGVTLTGSFDYAAGNLLIAGSQARLAVSPVGGATVAAWTQDLGILLPGASGTVARTWSSLGAGAGLYAVTFELWHDGEVLVSAAAGFELVSEILYSELSAIKSAKLAVDGDGDGAAGPGDRLAYRIRVANAGSGDATAVVVRDPIPPHTTLVAGSVTISHGSVVSTDPIEVAIPVLAAGATAEVSFAVDLDPVFPEGVTAVANQATVDADGVAGFVSDDPSTQQPADPTVTPVTSAPRLLASKTDVLADDRDGDGEPGPGDLLRYEIAVTNAGNAGATALRFEDHPPTHTTLVSGSVTAALGTVTRGNAAGDGFVEVTLAALAPGEQETVTFLVEVAAPLPDGVIAVANQGLLVSAELPVVATDDPDVAGDADPTVTQLTLVDAPTIEVSIGDADAGESSGAVELTVSLSAPAATDLNVGFATADGSARADQDYQAAAGTVTVSAGETAATLSVTLLDDLFFEGEETFTVILADPSSGELANSEAVVTLADDELCPGPEMLVNPGAERAPQDGEIPGWTRVESDWRPRLFDPDPQSGDAYFFAGEAEVAELIQDIDVSALAGAIAGGGQEFAFEGYLRVGDELPPDAARIVVEYRDAANAVVLDAWESEAPDSSAEWQRVSDIRTAPPETGWIRVRLLSTALTAGDNDGYFDGLSLRAAAAPTLSVADIAVYESDAVPAVFDLRLSCPLGGPVTVEFATAAGSATPVDDYLETSGSLEFAPGETAATVSVTVVADGAAEPPEDFFLEIASDAELAAYAAAAAATIFDGRSCPRGPGYWKTHRQAWPAEWLRLGDVVYDDVSLAALLAGGGPDQSDHLARQLVATRFNLSMGSDPSIQPTVEAADAFLVEYPPGSRPRGEAGDEAERLKDELDEYNNRECDDDDP
jgi:uncharacterized repeat protein (TIGR01451 family)